MLNFLINVLLGILAFCVARYIGSLVVPEGDERGNIITIIAIIVGILVFLANFAVQIRL